MWKTNRCIRACASVHPGLALSSLRRQELLCVTPMSVLTVVGENLHSALVTCIGTDTAAACRSCSGGELPPSVAKANHASSFYAKELPQYRYCFSLF